VTAAAPKVEVLHRDALFLVLYKPSGLATTSPAPGATLVDAARELDPRAPRLHPSSRLDAEVSGVVVFARTREATELLLAARRVGRYARTYVALAAKAPDPRQGDWRSAIAIDPHERRKRTIVDDGAPGARAAHTRYRTLVELKSATSLLLEPQTGRTHQLRVHAAHAGVPLLGDRHYGGASRVVLADGSVVSIRRTMLHCARVCLPDPHGGGALRFQAELPTDFQAAWAALGGERIALP
jgi:23S rRNA-/tRNA-specific pseudouridylate synthase